MTRLMLASLVAVAVVSFWASQAHASLVTYSFTAHIDTPVFDTGGIDTLTGSWTVDTSVAPSPTSTQNFASFIGAVTSMTFSIGADTWTGSGDIFVQHHFGSLTSDNYSVFSSQSSGPGKTEIFSGIPMTIGILAIILTQDPGTLFTDARNLPVDLPLNQFNVPPSGGFDNPQSHVDMQFLNSTGEQQAVLSANLLSLVATPVPSALPLFATGLGGLGLLGWRRKRKARTLA